MMMFGSWGLGGGEKNPMNVKKEEINIRSIAGILSLHMCLATVKYLKYETWQYHGARHS